MTNITFKDFMKAHKFTAGKMTNIGSLYGIEKKVFILTQITYTKNERGKWTETDRTTEKVTPEFYLNTIDAVPFFRNMGGLERLESGYTYFGYMPIKVSSTNPDRTKKIERLFKVDPEYITK